MPDLPYATLITEWQDAGFVGRVQVAMLLTARTKLFSGQALDQTKQAIAEDALGRKWIASPASFSGLVAFSVACQLIGKASLTDTTVTADADVFAAVNAVYDSFLAQL